MRRTLSSLIGTSLLFAAAAPGFAQRRPAPPKSEVARFIIQLTLDDEYHSITDRPDTKTTGKEDSILHLKLEATRAIKVEPGDGGSTEFENVDGPSPGSAEIQASGSGEERSAGIGTGPEHVGKWSSNFSGKAGVVNTISDDSPIAVGSPQFTDLGKGLVYNIKLKVPISGACSSTFTDDNGTRNLNECAGAAPRAVQFQLGDETNKKTEDGKPAFASSFEAALTIDPPLYPEVEKTQSKAELEKQPDIWVGAETRGDRSVGYKTNLVSTKTILDDNSDGVVRKEVQKITFSAQIVPGAAGASLTRINAPQIPFDLTKARGRSIFDIAGQTNLYG